MDMRRAQNSRIEVCRAGCCDRKRRQNGGRKSGQRNAADDAARRSGRGRDPRSYRAREGLDPKEIEDVILGCAMPEAEQGMNVARIASLRAGLPVDISAMTVNRFCSSGLQAIAIAADRIMAGQGDVAVAGGTESMSMVPMGGNKVAPNPWLMDHYPDAYLSMGLTAENLAKKYGITREQADEFSLASHQKGSGRHRCRKIQGRNRACRGELHRVRGRCEWNGRRRDNKWQARKP